VRGNGGPAALHGTEGHSGRRTAAQLREANAGAPHSATNIDQTLAGRNPCQVGQGIRQPTLRDIRRLVSIPQPMMDMRSPQQAIEQRAELIVATNRCGSNAWDGNHAGLPTSDQGRAEIPADATLSVGATNKSPKIRSGSATPIAPNAFE